MANFISTIAQSKMTLRGAGGYAQISDCYVHICGIFATVTICIAGHSLRALMYPKTKTLNNFILVVFFSCFKKFKCPGDILNSVSLPQFAALRSQLVDVFMI